MRFIDEVPIEIFSGNGGRGSASFRREKFVPFGGPDGGNGGRGGHVYFQGNAQLNTLLKFRGRRVYKAENGEDGHGRQQDGKFGDDLILQVPLGTQIRNADTKEILLDITEDQKKYLCLSGGMGGLGNTFFKSSVNQAPRYAQVGKPGESLQIILELKLIADFGLLGLPNAGKSTLLAAVSEAKPKIANYPFTTLVPQLGVVEYKKDHTFTMVDLPGPVEGASEGIGIGHRFLRHLERCPFIIHLVDATISDDPFDIFEQYTVIRRELLTFNPDLDYRPEIVVLTKIDALSDEEIQLRVDYFEKQLDRKVLAVSVLSKRNLDILLRICVGLLSKTPKELEQWGQNGTKLH